MRRRGRPRTADILTPREWEVLDLLRRGLSNREIADHLGISYDGARYHVSEILSKLGVNTRQQAADWRPEEAVATRRMWGISALGGLLPKLPLSLTGKGLAIGLVGGGAASVVLLAAGLLVMQERELEPTTAAMGKVAYVVDGNIWVKELPDGEPLQLTDSGSDLTPQWSADGEWLSFSRETPPGGSSETWIIRADGTGARSLGRDAFLVSWSPAEDRFVYWSNDEGIVLERADGTGQPLTLVPEPDDPDDVFAPGFYEWSPDGEWISLRDMFPAPTFSDERFYSVYRLPVAGGDPIVLYERPADAYGTEAEDQTDIDIRMHGWTPDGKFYLLSEAVQPQQDSPNPLSLEAGEEPVVQIGPGYEILVVSVDDGRVIETGLRTRDFELPGSPASNHVLVTAGVARWNWQDRRIALLQPETGSVAFLTETEFSAIQPAWSPRGDQVVYSAGPAERDAQYEDPQASEAFSQRKLWVVSADGSGRRQLTNDPRYRDEAPQWTLDGRHILFARIDLSEPSMQASLWLLAVETGRLERVAGGVFTSSERLRGGSYDIRMDQAPFWGQMFSYWHP